MKITKPTENLFTYIRQICEDHGMTANEVLKLVGLKDLNLKRFPIDHVGPTFKDLAETISTPEAELYAVAQYIPVDVFDTVFDVRTLTFLIWLARSPITRQHEIFVILDHLQKVSREVPQPPSQ